MASFKTQLIQAVKIVIRFGLIVLNDGFICLRSKKSLIIFESFNGNDINDNPAAIYQALVKTKPELRPSAYFGVKPKRYRALHAKYPEIKLVKRFSFKWVWLMAHAGYWVFNSRLPNWWRKNKGTTYIQTWHGTPLKHLGVDIEHVAIPGTKTEDYYRQFTREASRWDYLIAPNDYSKQIFRSAFQFHNQFLDIGYPRNDVLYQQNQPAIIRQLKQQLVGDAKATVVTYAPTWRDDDAIKTGQYHFELPFNLQRFFEQVDDRTILVLRPHYLVKDHIDIHGFEDRVKIIADEDIAKLYLVSDLLITDYSSVMFDFANLNRPMLFYAYDLEHYRDQLRGFYFDYQAEIPGPLATNERQFDKYLKQFSTSHDFQNYQSQMAGFNQKYCVWEDGTASQKVADLILRGIYK
ncbi:CDP-glycerol glycerophosphotransferase family protein [Secundilactobacillus folii]|uniref:CDP-glycerol glycerophosphotransferase family protein n=1 Tax=Secundilactobacillus folii TaxID=2678357 RepID=A0A7X3C1Y2_9LACO|nr:CDP-glycerol glycerophosphotransferase family protein [Secundilactobacillus folii]MTV81252.1 CDP-glycerol glycerophosphotransferase family protein [Secundilactobacillus folii]